MGVIDGVMGFDPRPLCHPECQCEIGFDSEDNQLPPSYLFTYPNTQTDATWAALPNSVYLDYSPGDSFGPCTWRWQSPSTPNFTIRLRLFWAGTPIPPTPPNTLLAELFLDSPFEFIDPIFVARQETFHAESVRPPHNKQFIFTTHFSCRVLGLPVACTSIPPFVCTPDICQCDR